MANQLMRDCDLCGRPTLHIQPSTSHLLHFFLSIVTAGVWVVVWFLTAQNNASQAQCTACGRERGLFGSARGGKRDTPVTPPNSRSPAPAADSVKPPSDVVGFCAQCGRKTHAIDGICARCGAAI